MIYLQLERRIINNDLWKIWRAVCGDIIYNTTSTADVRKHHDMAMWGNVEVNLHAFCILALDVDESSAASPSGFISWERNPGTQWLGEWEVPRARWNVVKGNIPEKEQSKTTKQPSENGRGQSRNWNQGFMDYTAGILTAQPWSSVTYSCFTALNVLLLAYVFLTQNADGWTNRRTSYCFLEIVIGNTIFR
jgi:hypothetical protein